MRHIDDGILHAYLDGALDAVADAGELPAGVTAVDVLEHLESCPDCSARLTQARAVKERAGAVLQDAGAADIDVPPFSQLANRPGVEHAGTVLRRPERSWLPLTWAATVLLALGAGWWGSILWQAEPQQLSDAGAIEASGAVQEDRSTEPITGAGDVATSSDQPPAAQQATSAESVRQTPVTTVPSPLADADAAVGAGADGGVQSAPRTGAADERVAATDTGDRQQSAGAVAAAPAPAPPPPVVAEARAAQVDPAWDLLDRLATTRADSAAWLTLGAAASDTLSAVIVEGAGAPTFAVATPAVGTGSLVRVRQRLTDGRSVELVFAQPAILSRSEFMPASPAMGLSATRSGAAGAAAANEAAKAMAAVELVSGRQEPDGTSEIVVRMTDTGAHVVMRAAMALNELAELAARLIRR